MPINADAMSSWIGDNRFFVIFMQAKGSMKIMAVTMMFFMLTPGPLDVNMMFSRIIDIPVAMINPMRHGFSPLRTACT